MSAPVRIAVVGAGLIGQRHAAALSVAPGAALHSVADPQPEARAAAAARGWRVHESL
jgi:predicted dehydrogenase